MKRKKRIAVVYTHFPHYRKPVFDALSKNRDYEFTFYYSPHGVSKTILSGQSSANHVPLPVRSWKGIMWQSGSIRLGLEHSFDGFIFLGNPFILSTWISAWLVRRRGKPVLFWTHGWLRPERGVKGWLRRMFYRLADILMVYGKRARDIGRDEGFEAAKIHVIYNSLDYLSQKKAREAATFAEGSLQRTFDTKPFFLSVSRLIRSVSLDQAIEAMSKLEKSCTLIVVGEGPERERLKELARDLGVDIQFLGALYEEEKLAPLFLGAKAVVSPGKVGLLAMHALAYGAPIITHDDLERQMPEVEAIEPGVTGAFFRYGDKDDLARRMSFFLEQTEEDRLRCRKAGIARIEESYTPQAQVAHIAAALDSVIKRSL